MKPTIEDIKEWFEENYPFEKKVMEEMGISFVNDDLYEIMVHMMTDYIEKKLIIFN